MLATKYYLEFPLITRERAHYARNFLASLFSKYANVLVHQAILQAQPALARMIDQIQPALEAQRG